MNAAAPPSGRRSDRRTVLLTFDGVQPLDVVGPHEVFAGANLAVDAAESPEPRDRLEVVAAEAGPVRSESGLQLAAGGALPDPAGPFDTVLVPGGNGAPAIAAAGGDLVRWLADAAPNRATAAS